MQIVNFSDIDPQEWDFVVEASPSAWFYHLWAWMALERKYWFPECRAFMVCSDSGEALAILPLYVSELGLSHGVERLLHSGIHRHTGLAAAPALSRKAEKRLQQVVMKEVFRIAEEIKANRIQLNAQNLAPANLPPLRQEIPFFVEDFHFHFGLKWRAGGIDPAPGEMSTNSDQIISLEQSEAQLLDNIENAAQRAIRKGIKEGVEVVEAGNDVSIEQLIELRRIAAERTQQVLMPEQYYADIAASLANGQQSILLAKLDGKIIGGIELIVNKSASSYFGGFGLNEYLNLRFYDVLQWYAILWSKNCGLKHYRLGPHFPDMPIESEIYKKGRFKKKFGGKPFHILQGSYFLTPELYTAPSDSSALPSSSAAASNESASASIAKPFYKRLISWVRRL
jgi:hypothetical protein